MVLKDYLVLKNLVGNCLDSPGKGGNISVKFGEKIAVKASGEDLKTQHIITVLGEESESYHVGETFTKLEKVSKPTMELSLHKKIKSKYVVHYHPVYVLPYLCSDYVFDFDCTVIDYHMPGKDLSDAINDPKEIVMLRNHGVIIHSDCLEKIKELYCIIFNKFFIDNTKKYTPDDVIDSQSKELWMFRMIMDHIALDKNLSIKELSDDSILNLLNNEDEKYRMEKMK